MWALSQGRLDLSGVERATHALLSSTPRQVQLRVKQSHTYIIAARSAILRRGTTC